MRRTVVLLAALLATSLFAAQPSRAQIMCSDEYVSSFDVPPDPHGAYPAWTAGDIECRQWFVVPIETPHGEIAVRGIGDVSVAATLPPGGLAAIEAGVVRARERMTGLGEYRLHDTAILISRARSSPTEPQPRFGYSDAWTVPGASADRTTECHITLFIQTDYSTEEIYYVVAHELFHCIQKATLSSLIVRSQNSTGAWWSEGSAEWFAAWTAGAQSRWDRAAPFDRAIAEHMPIHGMSYKAAIFFYWLHETHGGASEILPFLRQMSPGIDMNSQELAMQRVLTPEQWLAFAQAYDDREINYPGGGRVGFGQRLEGETWPVEATSSHSRLLKSYVIGVGWADYACGRWANTVTEANIGVQPEHQDSWTRWPGEIDTRDSAGAGRRYRMVGLITEPGREVEFTLEAERREACSACLTRSVVDRCVVGRWRQTGGGPLEYLRSRGVPITIANQTELVITLNDDGTFSTNAINTDVEMEQTMPRGRTLRSTGIGQTSAVSGRWSAEDGELLGCIDSGGIPEGMTYFEAAGQTRMSPWSGGVAGTGGATTYTCSDSTFTTSSPTAHGPMNYEFTRETPPPRRR
ncbi:MAG: hypothetical protein ACT4OF_15130 [Caulobacteraceae bacterium]